MPNTHRVRVIPWILGVVLLACSLIGANNLLKNEPPGGGKPNATSSGVSTSGTILLGLVDSEPSPILVGPPALPVPVTVKEVLVKEGDEVKPFAPLVQFDDSLFKLKLKQAEAELQAARELEKKAVALQAAHKIQLARQKAAVTKANDELAEAERILAIESEKFERFLASEKDFSTNKPLSEEEKARRRRENTELNTARAKVNSLRALAEDEPKKLEALELTPIEADLAAATAQVAGLMAKVDEAKEAIKLCVVRAGHVGGVVEQIAAAPTVVFGPASRGSVLTLVPIGSRVVRAEAEAEFAFKIADKIGKSVMIYDSNNFALTYNGTIRRISTAYLPRRSASEFQLNPPKTLELLIDVTDPNPPGKPPLKVGQPVRVSVP